MIYRYTRARLGWFICVYVQTTNIATPGTKKYQEKSLLGSAFAFLCPGAFEQPEEIINFVECKYWIGTFGWKTLFFSSEFSPGFRLQHAHTIPRVCFFGESHRRRLVGGHVTRDGFVSPPGTVVDGANGFSADCCSSRRCSWQFFFHFIGRTRGNENPSRTEIGFQQ